MDGRTIFDAVTYNMSELISEIEIRYQNGKIVLISENNLDAAKPRMISSQNGGRCYELTLRQRELSLFYIQVRMKRDLEIFFDLPFHFYTNSRPSINANATQRMYLQVGYEILKINHDKNCKIYSDSYAGSFDECKVTDLESKIKTKFNCSVPFLMKEGPLCEGEDTKRASDFYDEYFEIESSECPQACHSLITSFGMPKYTPQEPHKHHGHIGKARLYFHNIIKETKDFVSYDLLR